MRGRTIQKVVDTPPMRTTERGEGTAELRVTDPAAVSSDAVPGPVTGAVYRPVARAETRKIGTESGGFPRRSPDFTRFSNQKEA
jgi:hypothetical protein